MNSKKNLIRSIIDHSWHIIHKRLVDQKNLQEHAYSSSGSFLRDSPLVEHTRSPEDFQSLVNPRSVEAARLRDQPVLDPKSSLLLGIFDAENSEESNGASKVHIER